VLADHLVESRLRIATGADEVLLRVVDFVLVECGNRFRQLELLFQLFDVRRACLRHLRSQSLDGCLVGRECALRFLEPCVDLLRFGSGRRRPRCHAPHGSGEREVARFIRETER
jgi:hypothetical protein